MMKNKVSNIAFMAVVLACISISHIMAQELTRDGQTRQNPRDQRRRAQNLQRTVQQEILYLTQEQEDEALKYIRETYTDRAERLIRWKDVRPEAYKNALSKAFREMRFMEELKERDPDRYARVMEEKRLESQSRELAAAYRQSDDDAERERLHKEMEDLLSKLFDYRQINRLDEIDRLEKKLEELKAANQERLDNKAEIVQRRLKELLGERRGFEW